MKFPLKAFRLASKAGIDLGDIESYLKEIDKLEQIAAIGWQCAGKGEAEAKRLAEETTKDEILDAAIRDSGGQASKKYFAPTSK